MRFEDAFKKVFGNNWAFFVFWSATPKTIVYLGRGPVGDIDLWFHRIPFP